MLGILSAQRIQCRSIQNDIMPSLRGVHMFIPTSQSNQYLLRSTVRILLRSTGRVHSIKMNVADTQVYIQKPLV